MEIPKNVKKTQRWRVQQPGIGGADIIYFDSEKEAKLYLKANPHCVMLSTQTRYYVKLPSGRIVTLTSETAKSMVKRGAAEYVPAK